MTRISRGWFVRLAAVALIPGSVVVCFLAVEFFLRLAGIGYPPAFFVPLGRNQLHVTNDRFGWRFFPRAMARAPDIEVVGPKPRGAYRIFILGESAAMGFPEPAFSFGRMLELMLEDRHRGVDVEVVNAAMTAINSHAILPVVRDAARYEPDLFVVYAGNNEVVGPYGPGTVFGGASLPLPLIRLQVWQTETRLGQTLASMWPGRQSATAWGGMEMFLNRRVAADDPRLARTYSEFRRNLQDIVSAAQGAGAQVMLSTVATNLAGCAPFASSSAGEGSAEAHYRLARSQFASADLEGGQQNARLARDLDTLRFRADSRINEAIRDVARTTSGVILADAELEFDAASPDGVPGANLFYEHAHLNFAGNYLLARMIAARIPAAWINASRGTELPSAEAIASRLAFTPWDEQRMAAQIAAMTARPPFTNQMGHAEDQRARDAEVEQLRERSASAGNRAAYAAALAARPGDLHIRARYADLLRDERDFAGAVREWRLLTERVPGRKAWHTSLAAALTDAGQFADAERECRRALDLDSQFDVAWFALGVLAARQGRYDDAAERYRQAIAIQPGYAEAYSNLGAAMAAQGKMAEALEQYRRALEREPGLASARQNMAAAHFALAGVRVQEGRLEDAAGHYRQALSYRPESADAHYNLGLILSRSGKSEEAISHYVEALRLKPSWPEAHNNLGTALARQGRFREASQHFRSALALRPDFAAARLNLERAAQTVR